MAKRTYGVDVMVRDPRTGGERTLGQLVAAFGIPYPPPMRRRGMARAAQQTQPMTIEARVGKRTKALETLRENIGSELAFVFVGRLSPKMPEVIRVRAIVVQVLVSVTDHMSVQVGAEAFR